MQTQDLTQLSTKELEQLLKSRKAAEAKKAEAERKQYEATRDTKIEAIITTARTMHRELEEFKQFCHIEMDEQAVKLSDYGKLRSNSKGGFTITHSDGSMRVTRRRDTEPSWDERSTKAIELIKDFLGDTIKKRDKDLYEILMGFLQRNEKGDLEYSRVMSLFQHSDKFNDSRWVEGLKLIKESYGNHLKGFGYEFKIKTESGHWQNLILNFSSI
ncbi:MAG: hypothetical protein CVU03_03460 [Bacteroidetes bacterium HGW-Bacteroidetes-2]|jgi:hypothetical protein|nr:MAG: hypothetical protein CVU03_03460 [Bacteroidetes bacterium HGW-Bacteroidetes-2]